MRRASRQPMARASPSDARFAGAARSAAFGGTARRLARQRVSLFVARVAGVSAHPLESHLVPGDLGVELFPEIQVFRSAPALVHRLDQVLAVAAKDHRDAGIESAQASIAAIISIRLLVV